MLRLTTTGRRSGEDRSVILGYLTDGSNLHTMAMNGWGDPDPAWWLNMQENPKARVELGTEEFVVLGRKAEGDERTRLWSAWQALDPELDAYAATRSRETAVVVLEPVSAE